MRRALTSLVVVIAFATFSSAEERKSWNKVRYVGGTIPIKAGKYDWNTTVTITSKPDTVAVSIAPNSVFARPQTVRVEPSQISSVVMGPGAWQRVADVPGAQLLAKPPTLFGLLLDRAFLGILYLGDDRKPAAMLLDSMHVGQIARVLEALTGKPLEYAK